MKKCVLIYDDDQEILFLCKVILSKQYHVEIVSRCENVINDIELLKPAIIIMDLWIPEIGGEQAIAEIKKNEGQPVEKKLEKELGVKFNESDSDIQKKMNPLNTFLLFYFQPMQTLPPSAKR